MKRGVDEKWLQERIEEDLIAMADERERELMEMPELQRIHMPSDKLADIYQRAEKYKGEHVAKKKKFRIRYRMVAAVAAVLVLCIGAGVISSGNKVYIPKISQSLRGDEVQTKVDNSDSTYREYDEEEICQEIQEKLGVIPVRLGYQPEGINLFEYWVGEKTNEAIVKYRVDNFELHIYISKDYEDSSISNQPDGENLDTIVIESCGISIPVEVIDDSENGEFYTTSFEYLNTYYSINGMMPKDEFIKVLENIWIENV